MYAVAVGDPFFGLTLYGPFEEYGEAEDFMIGQGDNAQIVPMHEV